MYTAVRTLARLMLSQDFAVAALAEKLLQSEEGDMREAMVKELGEACLQGWYITHAIQDFDDADYKGSSIASVRAGQKVVVEFHGRRGWVFASILPRDHGGGKLHEGWLPADCVGPRESMPPVQRDRMPMAFASAIVCNETRDSTEGFSLLRFDPQDIIAVWREGTDGWMEGSVVMRQGDTIVHERIRGWFKSGCVTEFPPSFTFSKGKNERHSSNAPVLIQHEITNHARVQDVPVELSEHLNSHALEQIIRTPSRDGDSRSFSWKDDPCFPPSPENENIVFLQVHLHMLDPHGEDEEEEPEVEVGITSANFVLRLSRHLGVSSRRLQVSKILGQDTFILKILPYYVVPPSQAGNIVSARRLEDMITELSHQTSEWSVSPVQDLSSDSISSKSSRSSFLAERRQVGASQIRIEVMEAGNLPLPADSRTRSLFLALTLRDDEMLYQTFSTRAVPIEVGLRSEEPALTGMDRGDSLSAKARWGEHFTFSMDGSELGRMTVSLELFEDMEDAPGRCVATVKPALRLSSLTRYNDLSMKLHMKMSWQDLDDRREPRLKVRFRFGSSLVDSSTSSGAANADDLTSMMSSLGRYRARESTTKFVTNQEGEHRWV